MRTNPKADWKIEDIGRACREVGYDLLKPGSGSHYKVRDPVTRRKYVIPAARPIRPVYVTGFVRFVDEGVS